ncbi:hypothetical protein L6452_37117 [Arctium lappa]|uniref:Uncharacterized protein n=1 Tax=Arctium lappa TaxID=4217 RepID=A0ACB8Y2V4_ARCLA|nr:hypothetical protein L6452_37117 [Arctium lappa]
MTQEEGSAIELYDNSSSKSSQGTNQVQRHNANPLRTLAEAAWSIGDSSSSHVPLESVTTEPFHKVLKKF